MTVITIDGNAIVYDSAGNPSAPPLVFIHGWTSDRHTFRQQIACFSRDYHCIAIDLPGHGDSDPVPGATYSIPFYLDRLQKVIAHLDMGHAHLIGHSLGGLLALELLTADNSRHPSAALIDPAPITKTPTVLASLTRTREMLKSMRRKNAQAILAAKIFFKKTDPEDLHLIVQQTASRADDEAALKTWDALIAHDSTHSLSRLQKPLLFINAERPQNREDDIRAFAPSILWGRTIGTGHFNHMVVPDQVNAMIGDFLKLQKAPVTALA